MKRFAACCVCLALFALSASAEVSLTEKQQLRQALGAPPNLSLEHILRQVGPKDTGSMTLIDGSGLQFFIDTDITYATTSSGEGACSEASYTHAVAASTLNGGTTNMTLNDMFDGYNSLQVNGTFYSGLVTITNGSTNIVSVGPATLLTNEHTVITGSKIIGNLQVWRKIYVPTNDTFCRWLDFVRNIGTTAVPVTLTVNNNLGSDNNTKIDADATSGTTVFAITNTLVNLTTTNDTWVSSFQNWTGTTSPDVRQGAVLFGLGGRVGLTSNYWVNGDDNPYWTYQFTLQPGQQRIIMNFVTGQPTRQAARTHAAALAAGANTNWDDYMSAIEKAQVLNFHMPHSTPNDFDGDGKSDIGVTMGSTWYLLQSSDGFKMTNGGKGVPVSGDFDGDGKADIASYNNLNGTWVIQNSGALPKSKRESLITTQQFGYFATAPVPADYDGDGRTDIAVYDQAHAIWYILGTTAGYSQTQFGPGGAEPVPGDYDGDGKADLAVYEPNSGMWSIMGSTAGLITQQFGYSQAKPVPGDYDGDGKTDIAVFDTARSTWYILGSTAGFSATKFGGLGAMPVVGDYDGDGKTDLAVYQALTGNWTIKASGGGTNTTQFGYILTKPLGGK